MDVQTADEKICTWYALQQQLKAVKADEMRLRKEIAAEVFNNAGTGTHHYTLPNNYDLKLVLTDDYTLTNSNNETDEALTHFSDDEGNLLVEWKPSLSVMNYKKLTPELQAHFAAALTIKPTAPSLTVVVPK